MICKLCKKNEGKNHVGKTLDICDSCLVDIQFAFSYHIGNKEVTKEEYEGTINALSIGKSGKTL